MPFWTSTSLTLILRQAAAVARQIPRTTGAVAISGRRARQALQRLSRETFPYLATPGHLLGRQPALAYAVQPIRIGSPRFQRPLSTHARLLNSSKTFRSGSSFALPRGPRVSTNLGLGSARTFASGPSASGVQNVPVVLRAFASLLSDEEVDKPLPRATRFKPYHPRRNALRRYRRRVDRCPSVSSIDCRLAELSHFFPYTRPSPASVVIPPTAESLVTLGTTTVLSLPLSPSLSALLTGTPQVPYLAAEVGVAILSSLTLGVLSLQEAFSIHYWHRIGPLLARLDSLGLLDSGPGSEGTGLRHEVVLDHMGRPDILRLTFMDRSEDDVRVLLDGCLEEEGGRVWWGLKEVREGQEEVSMELSKKERREMMEVWDETDRRPELSQAAQAEQVQVIFEAPESEFETDISLVLPVLDTASSSYSPSSVILAGLESWHESGTIDIDTPTSAYTPISELDLDLSSTSSNLSSPLSSSSVSLTESLLSHLSSLDSSSDSARWAVSPSENDSDVESAIEDMLDGSGSEVWEEEGRGLEVNMASSEDFGGWIGAGQGFGLAQPW